LASPSQDCDRSSNALPVGVKHFTRPVPSELASPCPKFLSDAFKNAETLDVRPFLLTVSFSWVKKSRRFPKEQTFHHSVYVILLSDTVKASFYFT
jgi:hypothetical protein